MYTDVLLLVIELIRVLQGTKLLKIILEIDRTIQICLNKRKEISVTDGWTLIIEKPNWESFHHSGLILEMFPLHSDIYVL